MKQRFSSLDIKVIAHELEQKLTSLRIVNIYDLSSRIFLFKFAKPDHKQQFVVDAGFRCHLTSFARTTANAPSPFVSRLRKFLKTRRVTSVSQVGTDRILEIQFSDGQYRLYLEFYAAGNIILTDTEYKVIALYRNVNEGAEHDRVRAGVTYTLSQRQNVAGVPDLSAARVKNGMRTFIERQSENEERQGKSRKVSSKKKNADFLRKALSSTIHEYPPMLLQHVLKVTGVNTELLPEEVLKDEAVVEQILGALKEAQRIVSNIGNKETATGYIIAKRRIPTAQQHEDEKTKQENLLLYDDYQPFKPLHFQDEAGIEIIEIDGFNNTVDEFYSSIEGQKLQSRLQEKMDTAQKKLEHAKEDQEKRLGGLQAVQELNVRKAQAIEANLERVEEAKAAINSLITQGMDWVEIDQLIALEQKKNNVVAQMIKLPLKLNENTAGLLLGELENDDEADGPDATDSEPSDSSDSEEDDHKQGGSSKSKGAPQAADKRLVVDIDLSLSAWSNAREYYDQKKTAASKQEKTALASTKALKSAQVKIEEDLKRALNKEKAILRPVRTPLWFEKFIYFISSENYLVIGGKDAQQNEIIFKRYFNKGDVYVHADLSGAASMFIKNNPNTPDAPIPPSTLSQAGHMSVCTSTAWDSKAVMSAWWAPAEQVSKVSPTNDLMPTGSFYIKSEKNFLPPAQLLLGFAVMWKISEASKAQHLKHRVPTQNSTDAGEDNSFEQKSTSSGSKQVPSISAATTDEVISELTDATSDREIETEDDIAQDNESEREVDGYKDDEHEWSEKEEEQEGDPRYQKYVNPLQSRHTGDKDATTTLEQLNSLQISHEASKQKDEQDFKEDDDDENDDGDDDEKTPQDASSSAPQAQSQESGKTKGPSNVRGKRGKRKKIAAKYADQDEEDREMAMRLLGSTAGQERAEAREREARAAEEAAARTKLRKKAQQEKALAAALSNSHQRDKSATAAAADTLNDDEDDEQQQLLRAVDLETLVGTLLPSDEIVEAIPVCAPWPALGRYKYKAKIQPGAQKKGKAVREILHKWGIDASNPKFIDQNAQDPERIWPTETEMIKAWKESEVFNVLPVSKVRVMMGRASSGAAGKSSSGAAGKGKGGGGGAQGRGKGGGSGGGGKKKKKK